MSEYVDGCELSRAERLAGRAARASRISELVPIRRTIQQFFELLVILARYTYGQHSGSR